MKKTPINDENTNKTTKHRETLKNRVRSKVYSAKRLVDIVLRVKQIISGLGNKSLYFFGIREIILLFFGNLG